MSYPRFEPQWQEKNKKKSKFKHIYIARDLYSKLKQKRNTCYVLKHEVKFDVQNSCWTLKDD